MESLMSHHLFERRHLLQSKAPAVKWFKEWVPQDVVATGGKCRILKWVTEDMLQALNEKSIEAEAPEPEPEPTTEVLFLCSYEGCGKTFVDVGALKKHSHIHGERQYVCHYEGCGKKFLDSSKLKRHFLIHTGERDFVCPHEGCGKAFSLDFNLRSHMKTHSQENYHICPYVDCGKRYAHEYKLKNHVSIHHEKGPMELTNYIPLPEKLAKTAKPMPPPMPVGGGSAVSMAPDRPYTCPLEGCDKAYIHMYKLNLHLRKGHKLTLPDDHAKPAAPPPFYPDNNEADEWSDQDVLAAYTMKQQQQRGKGSKQKQHKPSPKVPPSKMARRRGSSPPATSLKAWPVKEGVYREAGEDGDSEETEEDQDGGKDRWRLLENSGSDNGGGGGGDDTVDGGDDDEEETEYED